LLSLSLDGNYGKEAIDRDEETIWVRETKLDNDSLHVGNGNRINFLRSSAPNWKKKVEKRFVLEQCRTSLTSTLGNLIDQHGEK